MGCSERLFLLVLSRYPGLTLPLWMGISFGRLKNAPLDAAFSRDLFLISCAPDYIRLPMENEFTPPFLNPWRPVSVVQLLPFSRPDKL